MTDWNRNTMRIAPIARADAAADAGLRRFMLPRQRPPSTKRWDLPPFLRER